LVPSIHPILNWMDRWDQTHQFVSCCLLYVESHEGHSFVKRG